MNSPNCPHCQRIEFAAKGQLQTLIFETKQVIVIAGDHQFFPGYCVVIAKTHVREMHSLPPADALLIFADVLEVGRRIELEFRPLKINYASLGNIDEHLHWHVMPRYLDDPDHRDHPWKNAAHFSSKPTTSADIRRLRAIFSST
jgi:diadenosine tetraphosphate (Ap4A) HIT family hydrolase